jgi:hypothetical protein
MQKSISQIFLETAQSDLSVARFLSVRSGMAILPKKEMPILIYDMNWEFGGFRPIFLL